VLRRPSEPAAQTRQVKSDTKPLVRLPDSSGLKIACVSANENLMRKHQQRPQQYQIDIRGSDRFPRSNSVGAPPCH
jgi:hypothetical protein